MRASCKREQETPPWTCRDCKIGGDALYAVVLQNDPERIERARTGIRTFRAREIIFHEKTKPEKIYTLRRGWACLYKSFSDSRRYIFSFIVPGDTITPELLIAPQFALPYGVKALTECEACLFDVKTYAQLIKSDAQQTEHSAAAFDQYLEALCRKQVNLARRSAAARIANLVLELEGRLQQRECVNDGFFRFPLTQAHIADATALTPQHVNRIIVDWKKQNVIEFKGTCVRICDRQFLVDLADIG